MWTSWFGFLYPSRNFRNTRSVNSECSERDGPWVPRDSSSDSSDVLDAGDHRICLCGLSRNMYTCIHVHTHTQNHTHTRSCFFFSFYFLCVHAWVCMCNIYILLCACLVVNVYRHVCITVCGVYFISILRQSMNLPCHMKTSQDLALCRLCATLTLSQGR